MTGTPETTTDSGTPSEADAVPPWYRNVVVLGWIFQIAVAGSAVALVAWLLRNFKNASETLKIPTGFDYLDQPANFPIAGADFNQAQSVWDATVVGMKNTLYVVIAGIVLATILGVLVGIARLSGNWLLSKGAQVYVETLRNIPLLAVVAFAYLALILTVFPPIDEAWQVGSIAIFSNRAAAIPWFDGSAWSLTFAALAAALVTLGTIRWRARVADKTGALAHSGAWGLGTFVVVLGIGWLVTGLSITTPALDGRQVSGGMAVAPEYLALLLALVLYTASHIAEIVRGSIQAVPKGQTEAADSLALSPTQRMITIVLPQAMRIAIPPLGNQYLNLFKNSSLAVVVSYFELTKVTLTAVGNGQPAVPAFALLMLIYLIGSLILSQFVNLMNRRLELVDR